MIYPRTGFRGGGEIFFPCYVKLTSSNAVPLASWEELPCHGSKGRLYFTQLNWGKPFCVCVLYSTASDPRDNNQIKPMYGVGIPYS